MNPFALAALVSGTCLTLGGCFLPLPNIPAFVGVSLIIAGFSIEYGTHLHRKATMKPLTYAGLTGKPPVPEITPDVATGLCDVHLTQFRDAVRRERDGLAVDVAHLVAKGTSTRRLRDLAREVRRLTDGLRLLDTEAHTRAGIIPLEVTP